MKRIIAIDYGDARTGVAVSDLTGTMVGETLTIQEWNAQRLAQRLEQKFMLTVVDIADERINMVDGVRWEAEAELFNRRDNHNPSVFVLLYPFPVPNSSRPR